MTEGMYAKPMGVKKKGEARLKMITITIFV